MLSPLDLLTTWLAEEQSAGAPNAKPAVLSTCTKDNVPHARVVVIREINDKGLLFFTQRGNRKVRELLDNPQAVITYWFELLQRQVIIEGTVVPLSEAENEHYWKSYPRESQLRFTCYAPTSAQPITNKEVLENKMKQIEHEFKGQVIPLSPFYCGFRLRPERIMYYAIRTDALSDVFEYRQSDGVWTMQWLSP